MRKYRILELTFGLLAALLGPTTIFVALFAPLTSYHSQSITYHNNIPTTTTEQGGYISYVQANGFPSALYIFIATYLIFGLIVILDVVQPKKHYKSLLLCICFIMFLEILISAASIGLLLIPSFIFAILSFTVTAISDAPTRSKQIQSDHHNHTL